MLKKILLTLLLLLVFALSVLLILITQPFTDAAHHGPLPSAPQEALKAHVLKLAEEFSPRSFDDPENLEAAAKYIEERLVDAGGRVTRQPFKAKGRQYSNIIASFGPENGPVVIVGAHYDSFKNELNDNPGADDNASGVAGLLELARMLGANRPEKRVDLVAYCLEEPPFFGTRDMGSAVHAASLHSGGENVIAMICLEMIGYFNDEKDSQSYPVPGMTAIYPSQGNFIAIVGRFQETVVSYKVKHAMKGASGLPVKSINIPGILSGLDFSDHRNFWQYGYKAVMITNTAFYRNPAYHTAEDTADRLDYRRMALVVRGVYAAVQSLCSD